MLLIQIEGTPTAAAAPASTPKTRRRVMGTGDHEGRERARGHGALYGVCGPNLEPAARMTARRRTAHLQKRNYIQWLTPTTAGHFGQFLLDFRSFRAFNPPHFLGKTFFSTRRPALETGGQRPTARCALGRESVWTIVLALCAGTYAGRHTRLVRNCALGRGVQYAAASRFKRDALAYWITRLRG